MGGPRSGYDVGISEPHAEHGKLSYIDINAVNCPYGLQDLSVARSAVELSMCCTDLFPAQTADPLSSSVAHPCVRAHAMERSFVPSAAELALYAMYGSFPTPVHDSPSLGTFGKCHHLSGVTRSSVVVVRHGIFLAGSPADRTLNLGRRRCA